MNSFDNMSKLLKMKGFGIFIADVDKVREKIKPVD